MLSWTAPVVVEMCQPVGHKFFPGENSIPLTGNHFSRHPKEGQLRTDVVNWREQPVCIKYGMRVRQN